MVDTNLIWALANGSVNEVLDVIESPSQRAKRVGESLTTA